MQDVPLDFAEVTKISLSICHNSSWTYPPFTVSCETGFAAFPFCVSHDSTSFMIVLPTMYGHAD